MSFERTPLLLWALSGIYHPDRHDAITPVEGAEMIRHAEDRTGAELKRKSPENPVKSRLSGFPDGAGGGGRTRTSLRTRDFEGVTSFGS